MHGDASRRAAQCVGFDGYVVVCCGFGADKEHTESRWVGRTIYNLHFDLYILFFSVQARDVC